MEELVSGDRAATTVSFYFDFGPLARARFLAVREELLAEWNPDSPSASLLIDMLAQLHCAYERWMQRHMSALELGFTPERGDEAGHVWKPPRIFEAAALELSGEMVERFHRMSLRTIRQLRELQKNHQPVVVQNAGQVNVGNQQVNVQGKGKPRNR